MKYPPTIAHAFSDYTLGAVALMSPWLCSFSHDATATTCAMAFGVTIVAYSLVTDYELSLRRFLPIKAHLALDVVLAGLLTASPFVLGFSPTTWAPHVAMGGFFLGMAVLTAMYLRFGHPVGRVRAPAHRQIVV